MRFREPLLFPVAAIGLGITLAAYFPVETLPLVSAAVGISVLSSVAFRPGFLVALVFAGMAVYSLSPLPPAPALSVPDNTLAIFEGCVTEPAMVANDRERFTVQLAPHARARVILYAREGEQFPALPYGTRVEFEGKVRQPRNYEDPGTFDNVYYLARQQVYWTASADASRVKALPGKCGNALIGFVFSIRAAALSRLESLYKGDAYALGMMQAILIGETARLDRIWTNDYRSTGTFHALVISGSHVAVLAAMLLFLLRICGLPEAIALPLTVVAAWLYAGITGWQAPVLRSAAGMSLYVVARFFYRGQRLLNTVAAVALLFLLADPRQLFDPSFQLSFLAVALIGAFVIPALGATSGPLASALTDLDDAKKDVRLAPVSAQFRIELRLLAETLYLLTRLPRRFALGVVATFARVALYMYEIFVTSLFIQVGLALPMAVYFHRLSASGLTANALVVPILTALVPLGFGAILTNSHLLARFCAWLLSVARVAVSFHARWEPDWRIPAPPFWLACLFVLLLIAAALRRQKRWSLIAVWCGVAVVLAVIILHPFQPRIEAGRFELSVLDVGQGDSLLAVFPGGKLMLIDAGGIPSFGRTKRAGIDLGEDVVSPYLWSRSIRHLDVVVMTHAHEDHMGGMNAVLRNFHPAELWTGATPASPEWNSVRATAEQLHIRIIPQRRGVPFQWSGTTVQILSPGADYVPEATPKNNDSLAMRVKFGATSFLLTGDMEKQIERELAAEGLFQHDDVLKVGHHGSRTSTTDALLEAERPVFAFISAGFENSYGHPHPLIVQALRNQHATIYRTDQDGLVSISSDGRRLRIEKTLP